MAPRPLAPIFTRKVIYAAIVGSDLVRLESGGFAVLEDNHVVRAREHFVPAAGVVLVAAEPHARVAALRCGMRHGSGARQLG